ADLRWGLGLSVSLPLFDRNQGLRARRDAELRASSLRHEGALLRVEADVRDALQRYRTAAEELSIYETSVLEPATRNQDLLETAYAEGKLDLEALLLLRNQLLDAELGYWAAWARHREAWAALRSATGANLEDVTPASNEEGSR
ncbi:MAG: TolC family protein, partial [Gemmatimonadota bacterium]